MTQQRATEILDRNFDQLERDFPDHTGIGITKEGEEFVIRVAILHPDDEMRKKAAAGIEGLRIVLLEEDMTGEAY